MADIDEVLRLKNEEIRLNTIKFEQDELGLKRLKTQIELEKHLGSLKDKQHRERLKDLKTKELLLMTSKQKLAFDTVRIRNENELLSLEKSINSQRTIAKKQLTESRRNLMMIGESFLRIPRSLEPISAGFSKFFGIFGRVKTYTKSLSDYRSALEETNKKINEYEGLRLFNKKEPEITKVQKPIRPKAPILFKKEEKKEDTNSILEKIRSIFTKRLKPKPKVQKRSMQKPSDVRQTSIPKLGEIASLTKNFALLTTGVALLNVSMKFLQKMWESNIGGIQTFVNKITGLFKNTLGRLEVLFKRILNSVGPILEQSFGMIASSVEKLITSIEPVIEKILPVLAEAFTELFVTLGPIISEIIDLMTPIIVRMLPVASKLLASIVRLIGPLLKIIMPFVTFLIKGLDALAKILEPVINFISSLTDSFAKFLKKNTKPDDDVIDGTKIPSNINNAVNTHNANRSLYDNRNISVTVNAPNVSPNNANSIANLFAENIHANSML